MWLISNDAPFWRGSGGMLLALLGVGGRVGPVERGASIDDLLDRAVAVIDRGDRVTLTALAGRVLAVDEAERRSRGLAGSARRCR